MRRRCFWTWIWMVVALSLMIAGCNSQVLNNKDAKSGVFYEIFVRSFYDSNGDGIGDLRGVTMKLDYLQELGVSGIWLMPIHPSPSYHGYDVTDYYTVNPDYGTLDDLKQLTEEAHKRGISVIIDFVANHTSDKHPWFVDSAKGKDNPYRNWYIWNEGENTKLPADGATGAYPWHDLGGSRYLGIFWEGMPDLNFDEPAVRSEMIKIGQFWLKQGVDGFRLDAAKHVNEDFKSTAASPETKQKNVAWWQEFRNGLNEVKKDAYVVGEIWDSPVVIAPYLEQALDEGFNFDLAKKLVSAASRETDADIAFALNRTYGLYAKYTGGKIADAPFLTNHDQNRVMSELEGDLNHAKTAAAMLMTLPGTPYMYYGEEIGMKGMKPDEYIREPMLWGEEGDKGQTRWETSRYNVKDPVTVSASKSDKSSLWYTYQMLIDWRKREPLLRTGGIDEFTTGNALVTAYLRTAEKERVLVVHNMSGSEQTVKVAVPQDQKAFGKVTLASSEGIELSGSELKLPPYASAILK
ncbi:alpha-amylase [Paenibacillus albiflavus]|uniref:Alpha-amylase n=1 Tax=Paenibacillus albiflavus TaxID=2545760 RepID=A0A4R4E5D9_9BACL|nr:alpha-amylase family glycosyl hydrolase [Paenibacillus albiflavus]TCZ74699.1 alpha-amylase [Paenibacillus albiflavus]